MNIYDLLYDPDDADEDEDTALAALIRREMVKLHIKELELALRRAGKQPIDWKKLPAVGNVTETLDITLEVKAVDSANDTIDGYLSTWDKDYGNDQIHRGAFAKTLALATFKAAQNRTAALYPLLFQHDPKDPVGAIVSAKEDIHGLRIRTRLNTTIEHGRQALHGLANGYMAFSIGYRPTKYEWQAGVRHLTEIDLKEGSAVTYPMNPYARAIGGQ
jgi:HK97 family phage prohead protease